MFEQRTYTSDRPELQFNFREDLAAPPSQNRLRLAFAEPSQIIWSFVMQSVWFAENSAKDRPLET
jgi:hypothetical protein